MATAMNGRLSKGTRPVPTIEQCAHQLMRALETGSITFDTACERARRIVSALSDSPRIGNRRAPKSYVNRQFLMPLCQKFERELARATGNVERVIADLRRASEAPTFKTRAGSASRPLAKNLVQTVFRTPPGSPRRRLSYR